MPTYSFWYSETATYKGYFVADNEEHAKALLEKVRNHQEINVEDLPDWEAKLKEYDVEIDPQTLAESGHTPFSLSF